MSDYRDTIKAAIENGFYLDSCGSDDMKYVWGRYIDLCGMEIEDAIPYSPEDCCCGGGGDESAKTKNTVTLLMAENSEGNYTLRFSAQYASTNDYVVSFVMDGATRLVTVPAGSSMFDSGLMGETPQKPYAVISDITIMSESEKYTYIAKNTVKTGLFTLTVNKESEQIKETLKYGTVYTLPFVEERTGYDFVWKDENGNVITGDTITMPEKNTTINGNYVLQSYELTYNIVEFNYVNGSIESSITTNDITLAYGTNILNALNGLTPEKEGHTFSGWKYDDGTAVPSTATMPNEDILVTCTYELNTYTLTYKSDGNVFTAETYYFRQNIIPLSETPSKEGYTFNGWDAVIPQLMPASDLVVNAVYHANQYNVNYYVDGVATYTDTYDYGQTIVLREPETKEGYTFSGWSEAPETMPAHDVDIYGTFTINTYALAYMVDGEVYTAQTYEYGETITPIDEPTREGYTFSGWQGVPETMPAHDVTVTGEFIVNQYTITYVVDGETYSSQTWNYGETIVPLADPEKEGYTFGGWQGVPDTMPASDVTVTGTFTINTYVATYVVDGEPYSSQTYEYGELIIPITEPEKEGYTFSGWQDVPETMPANDITITGEFAINQYTIYYKVDGEDYSSQTLNYGETIILIAEPEKEGYTFGGWSEAPETMPAHDITITGTFAINSYILNYMVDGEPYSSQTYEYGETIVPLADPEKEGYTFGGWQGVPETMPANDVTVTGTFAINEYTIEYMVDGELYSSQTYNYGETVVPVDEPTREGYTFSGWQGVPETMPAHDVTVTGEFNIAQYTLSFRVDNKPYTSVTGEYGTAVPEIATPSMVGYTFSGWDKEIPQTFPAQDMTFDGTLIANTHVANYVIDGEPYSSVTYNYGQAIIYPNIPREGYILRWDKVHQTMPDYDITITGTYVEVKEETTIYYDAIYTSGDTGISDVSGFNSYEYEDGAESALTFTIPANPEYTTAEEEYEEEEFEQWCEDHEYTAYFAKPVGTSFIFKDALGNDLTNLVAVVGSEFVVNGANYQGYAYRTNTCCVASDINLTYKLTITKN